MAWVQVNEIKYVARHGKLITVKPGEWVAVSSEAARQWIADGSAVLAEAPPATLEGEHWGIAPRDAGGREWAKQLAAQLTSDSDVDIAARYKLGDELPYARTLLVKGEPGLRPELVAVGLAKLDSWQVVAPLWKYEVLARDVGTKKARAYAEGVVHDLRCLLYHAGVVFVRRSADTGRFMELWRDEMKPCGRNEQLAFLTALYKAKPLALAVPITWWAGRDAVP